MSRKPEIASRLFPDTDFLAFLLSFALQLYGLQSIFFFFCLFEICINKSYTVFFPFGFVVVAPTYLMSIRFIYIVAQSDIHCFMLFYEYITICVSTYVRWVNSTLDFHRIFLWIFLCTYLYCLLYPWGFIQFSFPSS